MMKIAECIKHSNRDFGLTGYFKGRQYKYKKVFLRNFSGHSFIRIWKMKGNYDDISKEAFKIHFKKVSECNEETK